MKVLLVEDSRLVASVVQATLTAWMTDVDLRIERTLSGGIRALETWKPNAIILDVGLPDSGDPRNVVEAFSSKSKVPIIVFTGETCVGDWAADVADKVVGVVPKGQSPRSLVPLLVHLEKARTGKARKWAWILVDAYVFLWQTVKLIWRSK